MSNQPVAVEMEETMSQEMKTKIVNNILEPHFEREISALSNWQYRFERTADVCRTLTKLSSGIATILAFADGFYGTNKSFSFWSGCMGTISLVLSQLSSYADNEQKNRTRLLRQHLMNINIQPTHV